MSKGCRSGVWVGVVVMTALMMGPADMAAAPGDVTLKSKNAGQRVPVTVFPHWKHRIHYRCYVCHPVLYPMKTGETEISMSQINQGKSCGQCHNGIVAFDAGFQNCSRCHPAFGAKTER